MKSFPIIRVVTKLLIPYILLFGLYVQFHGDFGPGGGFQAGVILASALILYGMVFGLSAMESVAPKAVIEKLVALGLLIYGGTGIATMLLGGNFLDYDVLVWGEGHHGAAQHAAEHPNGEHHAPNEHPADNHVGKPDSHTHDESKEHEHDESGEHHELTSDHANEGGNEKHHHDKDGEHDEHAHDEHTHEEHLIPQGQHLGIFLVELGVGITVTSVMTMIFYSFAGRKQRLGREPKQ